MCTTVRICQFEVCYIILKCLCYVGSCTTYIQYVYIYHAREVCLQAMQIASVRTVDVIVLGV